MTPRKSRTTPGKPAEPSAMTIQAVIQRTAGHEGRTLREHFAGLSMQGIRAGGSSVIAEVAAKLAVQDADALISLLSKDGAK